jgi:hypothetical protein
MKSRVLTTFLLFLLLPGLSIAQDCTNGSAGSAFVNHIINWELTGDLYFSVVGPPNTCGDLTSTRNGSFYDYGPVVCTNAQGQAILGPYTWASRTIDQSDTNLLVGWPDSTCTRFTTNHYWDVTCPTPDIDPGVPGNFTGTGTDGTGGAGFSNSWTLISLKFYYNTTGKYWDPSTGDYTAVSPPPIYGTITAGAGTIGPGTNDSPSYSMHWGTPQVPSADNPGLYTWYVSLGESESRCISSNPGSTKWVQFRVRRVGDPPIVCGVDTACP